MDFEASPASSKYGIVMQSLLPVHATIYSIYRQTANQTATKGLESRCNNMQRAPKWQASESLKVSKPSGKSRKT